MTSGDRPLYVTRREFNGAMIVVWLYIMLVIGDLIRIEFRWTMAILWAASFFMVIAYAFTVFRGAGVGSGGNYPPAPLSDRVKELARDPTRKIEAIKLYREETGEGLAEAKEAVEAYVRSL